MKQNINVRSKLPLLIVLLLGLATAVRAQTTPAPAASPTPVTTTSDATMDTANHGLLGEHYYSLDYGYIHHVDGPPNVLHRYGFAANNPLQPGFDVGLKYDYLNGSAFGRSAHAQEASIPLTAYLLQGWGRPFLEGDAGWLWQHGGAGGHTDSFAYLLGTGVELQLQRRIVLTPFVDYQEAPHIGNHGWNYGAKGTFRFTREWGASLAAQIDDDHNLEYTGGLNFHF
ncbi:MAG TPA: hypothetical protein VG838_04190 [Opitutaceae bacterium]|nr:hypothetical protein [Opitutaceae bacterium]